MTTSQPRAILVSGATGKQGGALITALLSSSTPTPFKLYAITRNPASPASLSLSQRGVTLVKGDWSNPSSIFRQVPSPWGFFSVTMPMNASREEAQGKAMTAAALDAGVRHIVFTATDRGADPENDPTPVPHFASKFAIEKDIITQVAKRGPGVTYTFLRPTGFFENMTDDFLGRGFVAMWRRNGSQSALKFVSSKDVGKVAAKAFLGADEPQFRNRAVSLAGQEMTVQDAERVFSEVTGKALPETFGFVGSGLRWVLREQLGTMFDWFRDSGFGVEVKESKAEFPFLMGFEEWLRTESAWRKE